MAYNERTVQEPSKSSRSCTTLHRIGTSVRFALRTIMYQLSYMMLQR